MKICFLEGDMSRRGGTERMTAMLSNALCKNNEVWVISLRLSNNEVYFELDDKVKHYTLSTVAGKLGIIKQIKAIHVFVKEHRIDSIINVDVGMGFYGILAAKGTKAKVITWEHANYFNNWNSRIFKYIRIFAAKYSDAMVVLTESDKTNYERHIKSTKPVYVIPNPIVAQEYSYDINSKVILSAGLLLPIKGYDKAIKVAEQVLPRYPEWKWIICGDGPEREYLQNLIEQAGLEKQMMLVGNVKDMSEQYCKAAMFVLTSKMEGLPMVLLEAKSWGLPLISFDIMTGPSDIIEDGVNGYLIDAFDVENMAEKIEELVRNTNQRICFSEKSQLNIEKYNYKKIIMKWEKILGV